MDKIIVRDEYEESMYKFLTEPDNFKNMVKVMGFRDMLQGHLIVEFWMEVVQKLEELNKALGDKWMIKKPKTKQDYFGGENSSIDLYKLSWTENGKDSPITICWASPADKMFYAIWVYHDFHNKDGVFRKLNPIAVERKLGSNENWPLFSNNYNYNFMNFAELEHILPDYRGTLSTEFANTLFDLATEFEGILDEAVKKMEPSSNNPEVNTGQAI